MSYAGIIPKLIELSRNSFANLENPTWEDRTETATPKFNRQVVADVPVHHPHTPEMATFHEHVSPLFNLSDILRRSFSWGGDI